MLSNEECHEALSYMYDELMDARPPAMAVSSGELQIIYAKSSPYHNSFLPRTVREMKISH